MIKFKKYKDRIIVPHIIDGKRVGYYSCHKDVVGMITAGEDIEFGEIVTTRKHSSEIFRWRVDE